MAGSHLTFFILAPGRSCQGLERCSGWPGWPLWITAKIGRLQFVPGTLQARRGARSLGYGGMPPTTSPFRDFAGRSRTDPRPSCRSGRRRASCRRTGVLLVVGDDHELVEAGQNPNGIATVQMHDYHLRRFCRQIAGPPHLLTPCSPSGPVGTQQGEDTLS